LAGMEELVHHYVNITLSYLKVRGGSKQVVEE
jgi:hypothetical protein